MDTTVASPERGRCDGSLFLPEDASAPLEVPDGFELLRTPWTPFERLKKRCFLGGIYLRRNDGDGSNL